MLASDVVAQMIDLAVSPDQVWRSLMDLMEGKQFNTYPISLLKPDVDLTQCDTRQEYIGTLEIQRSTEKYFVEHMSSLLRLKPDQFVPLVNNCLNSQLSFDDLCREVRLWKGFVEMFEIVQKNWIKRLPQEENPYAISYHQLSKIVLLEKEVKMLEKVYFDAIKKSGK